MRAPPSDLVGAIDAVKGAAKKALAAQEQTLEHNDHTAASLQGIKQVTLVSSVAILFSYVRELFTLSPHGGTGQSPVTLGPIAATVAHFTLCICVLDICISLISHFVFVC